MRARPLLGILGGLGPLAGAHFYRLILEQTHALCDADYPDVLLDGHCATPDRSSYLTAQSASSPLPSLLARAQRLCVAGADCLAIPCNTAHAFYPELCRALPIPVLHIAMEAIESLWQDGVRCVGILCTEGTRKSRLYDRLCNGLGILCLYPEREEQAALSTLIFAHLKAGGAPDGSLLLPFCASLRARGCERVLLACTELSLCYAPTTAPADCVDAMTLFARRCVSVCHCTPIPMKGEAL